MFCVWSFCFVRTHLGSCHCNNIHKLCFNAIVQLFDKSAIFTLPWSRESKAKEGYWSTSPNVNAHLHWIHLFFTTIVAHSLVYLRFPFHFHSPNPPSTSTPSIPHLFPVFHRFSSHSLFFTSPSRCLPPHPLPSLRAPEGTGGIVAMNLVCTSGGACTYDPADSSCTHSQDLVVLCSKQSMCWCM